ncbi:alcohol oxidase [Earliella scabrosa]|nr:alcohol oxidase [Earliella scabrosa]
MYSTIAGIILCTSAYVAASETGRGRTFDYVVVGGGTAGLVVAGRLSEDPHVTVAVIEAGAHHVDEPMINTPELFGQAIGNPTFDWNFFTVPQAGLNNASFLYPRGKMLGGCSGLNFMAWDRASVKEYDAWETLGAKGWNWKTLLPYFKKTEAVAPQTSSQLFPGAVEVDESTFNAFHGRSGPVQASYNVLYTNITGPYVETINGLGIPTNSDPYMGDGTGVYNCEMTIDRVRDLGQRSYAANTYYNSSVEKPNLTVFLATQATKVNFLRRGSSLRAGSVEVIAVDDTGVTGTLTARKEVILAAGSIQTPQLLELSGIGDKKILSSVGIKTLVDLPGVGENLQDHTLLAQDFEILDTFFTYDELRNNATYLAEQQEEYAANHTGIFASAQFALTFPPLKSVVSPKTLSSLRAKADKLGRSRGLSALTKAQYKFQADWLAADDVAYMEYIMFPTGGRTPVSPTPNSVYITMWVGLMHPFSRGAVHINSSDPLRQPTIDPRYLDNDVDLELALESTKFVRKVTESEPLASFVVAPHQPTSAEVSTDAEWLEYIRTYLGTIYHPMGTAAMLPREIGGVVDPKTLKVYGTSNLRVVDASVIPMILAAHPVSTIYAIAERAADMIKGHV